MGDLTIRESRQVTKDLVDEAGAIAYEVPSKQLDWLYKVGQTIRGWEDISDFSLMREAELLYWVNWRWEHSDVTERLHPEATSKWDGDFYKWAKAFTKRRALKEPAEITIANKIATFRDWEGEKKIEAPKSVFIPKRDDKGQIVEGDLKYEDAWQEVPFDISNIDYGKLLVARGAAKRGEMDCEAWTALVDPYATVGELKEAMQRDRDKNGKEDNTDPLRFYRDGDFIIAHKDGQNVHVLCLLSENADNEVYQDALTHIMAVLGLAHSSALADK